MFAYAAIFSPSLGRYPILSSQQLLTGESTLSTGLSRGFSSIARFRFEEARKFNPYSIRIFSFFLLQLLMRISFIWVQGILTVRHLQKLIIVDGVISALMFILFFWPFLEEMFL